MPTSKERCKFILEQLNLLDGVTARPMMGEFLLYYQGTHFGGIYDGRLLIKETPTNATYDLPRAIPYETAKRTMYHLEDLDDKKKLKEIILATCAGLPQKTRRR